MRVSDERTLRKMFNTKPVGTRNVGRPKLRWEDGVAQGTQILGFRDGRTPPSIEMNGQNSSRRPGSTKDCRANDDDDPLKLNLGVFLSEITT